MTKKIGSLIFNYSRANMQLLSLSFVILGEPRRNTEREREREYGESVGGKHRRLRKKECELQRELEGERERERLCHGGAHKTVKEYT